MKRLALLLAAAAAACSSGPPTVGARFAGPTAIVEFWGVTRNNPGPAVDRSGLRPYLAVADARGADLRLLDPSLDQPVLGPSVVYPLSVTTLPRPMRLAAASLGDQNSGGADALVSASAGEPTLEVVETWTTQNRIAFEIPLADLLGADAEILAMTGLTPAGAGRGRIVASASGGRLVMVDFTRGPNGEVVAGTPVVKTMGFDAVDLALGPDDRTIYAASRDPLGTRSDGSPLYGIASFDASGDPAAALTVTPLDALAPTVAVAAALVDERTVGTGDPCAAEKFVGTQLLRVYAALDPAACGPDRAIACGLATLDPARTYQTDADRLASGQLAADPAAAAAPAAAPGTPAVPAQSFRAPMPVPGVPLHVAVGGAPTLNPDSAAIVRSSDTIPSTACPTSSATPLTGVLYGPSLRYTSAVAVVTSSDGRVYWFDLSRFGPVNDNTTLVGASRTAVVRAASDAVAAGAWQLGVYYDTPGSTVTGNVITDAVTLPATIDVWPGSTPPGEWSAVYQGALPGMQGRPGAVAIATDGTAWAALQSDTGQTSIGQTPLGVGDAARWAVSVRVDDPGRGVRVGDLVTFPDLGCEAAVASIVPGAADLVLGGVAFPGGALQLAAPLPACLAAAASPLRAQITILAADVVVSNDALGYLGRAPISVSTDPTDGVYALAWQPEAPLAASSARADQEQLAVVRRARRLFYPTDGPCPQAGATGGTAADPVGCYTGFPRLGDPLTPGPAIRFRLGLRNPSAPALAATAADRPPRGVGVHFATQTGLIQASRKPILGGTPPAYLTVIDPGLIPGHENENLRFYVTYQDDQVMSFVSTDSASLVHDLR